MIYAATYHNEDTWLDGKTIKTMDELIDWVYDTFVSFPFDERFDEESLEAVQKVDDDEDEDEEDEDEEDEDEDEEDEEEEVRCVCPDCYAEGKCMVSKRRAKELEKQELMEECCPFGDKCTYDSDEESDDDDEESDEN